MRKRACRFAIKSRRHKTWSSAQSPALNQSVKTRTVREHARPQTEYEHEKTEGFCGFPSSGVRDVRGVRGISLQLEREDYLMLIINDWEKGNAKPRTLRTPRTGWHAAAGVTHL